MADPVQVDAQRLSLLIESINGRFWQSLAVAQACQEPISHISHILCFPGVCLPRAAFHTLAGTSCAYILLLSGSHHPVCREAGR